MHETATMLILARSRMVSPLPLAGEGRVRASVVRHSKSESPSSAFGTFSRTAGEGKAPG
jgi:hypothetical protein